MKKTDPLASLSFFVSFTTLLLVGLAIFGFFHSGAIIAVLALGVVLWLGFLIWKKNELEWTKWELLMVALAVVLAIFTMAYQHDLPRGRDDMGLLTAAVQLKESETLSFHDPISYPFHPYRAIAPETFTSQFLPGYTVLLATALQFGDIASTGVVNGILIFLTLLTFYLLGRELHSRYAGFGFVLVFATSYLFFWIPRRTLSENLFILLIWLAAYALVRGYRERSGLWLLLGTIPLAVGLLARVESILFLAAYMVAAGLALYAKRKEFHIRAWQWSLLVPLLAAGYFLWTYTQRFGGTYLADSYGHVLTSETALPLIGAGLVGLFLLFVVATLLQRYHIALRRTAKVLVVSMVLGELVLLLWWLPQQVQLPWSALKTHFVLESFVPYFILPFALIAFVAYLRGSFRPAILWLILFLAPSFIFLWDPLIALDQPWFMRRYYPVLIPLILLLGSVGLAELFKRWKRIAFVSIAFLAILQLVLFHPMIRFKEHQGVGESLEEFAESFGEDDLVLMEPGWAWQQWAYALHYVYGLAILPNLDEMPRATLESLLSQHDAVYIITKSNEQRYPGIPDTAMIYERTFTMNFAELQRTTNINRYLQDNEELDIDFIRWSRLQNPPLTFSTQTEEWMVYRVEDKTILTPASLVKEQQSM